MTGNFKIIHKEHILANTHVRRFETKLGEVVQCCREQTSLEESLEQSNAPYVVFGIPEDAGVIANYGMAGASTLWPVFLESFLNIQSNDFLKGEQIFLAGAFDFTEELKLINATAPDREEKVMALRRLVQQIDEQVEEVVKIICRQGKIPIIIGGGHNNAYGAIKGAAKGLHQREAIPLAQISAINLDAHADYRMHEGRHSGNAFRYADEDGYLNKYFVIGLHENYAQEYVIKDMSESPFLDYITFEDIFIRERQSFIQAVAHATGFVEDNHTGVELDLDSISNTLSSAISPTGVSSLDARKYIHFVATECKVAYVHICEGAVALENGRTNRLTAKLVSYLVSDFIKSHFLANLNGIHRKGE